MSTAATAEVQNPLPAASEREPALPFRGDTFLGVCEAIGQDLGFHPNWLRIPFAALILWNPTAIIAVYLGLGGVVAGTRWLFPPEQKQEAAPVVTETRVEAPKAPVQEKSEELLAA